MKLASFLKLGAEDEIAVRDTILDDRGDVPVTRFVHCTGKKLWLMFSVLFQDWELWVLVLSGGGLVFFVISNALDGGVNDLAEKENSRGLERKFWF
jgi:hypothetical protein